MDWRFSSDLSAAAPSRTGLAVTFLLLLVGTVRSDGCRISTGTLGVLGSAAIEVATSTIGEDPDPDGYTAVITDEFDRVQTSSIGANDRVTFTDLEGGLSYAVELTGVSANCEIIGEDVVELFLAAEATASVSFEVECRRIAPAPGV